MTHLIYTSSSAIQKEAYYVLGNSLSDATYDQIDLMVLQGIIPALFYFPEVALYIVLRCYTTDSISHMTYE
jgi:hypothetical protein